MKLIRKLSKVVMVLLVLMFVGAGMSYAAWGDMWNPTSGTDFRLQSDDGVHPSTFTVHCNVNLSSPVYMQDGIMKTDYYHLIPIASTVAFLTVDISTLTLATGATTFYIPESLQPKQARRIKGAFNVYKSTDYVSANITYVGKNARGQSISEVVITTNNAGTSTNNAFAWLSYYTIGAASMAYDVDGGSVCTTFVDIGKVRFNLGFGDEIGLKGDIQTKADIISAVVVSSKTDTTYTITYDSVTVNGQYDWIRYDTSQDGSFSMWVDYIAHYFR